MFICKFKNAGDEAVKQIIWQQFLPQNVRPVIHTMKVHRKSADGRVEELGMTDSKVKLTSDIAFDADSSSQMRVDIGDGSATVLQPG